MADSVQAPAASLVQLAEDFGAFCDYFTLAPFAWQREAFGEAFKREAGRFTYRLAAISVPRGNGKSHGAALAAVWRLIFGPPPQDILCAALDVDGARVLLDHAKRIVRSHPDLEDAVETRAASLHVRETGSRLTITSREHTASRGRHPTLICYDEVGWARDSELFASLLAGQASAPDPLFLIVSTVGRSRTGPLWTCKGMAEERPGQDVLWWYSSENPSPLVDENFLERQRRILMPGQYAREHQNAWVDSADSFTTAALVDQAMGTGWTGRERGAGEPHVISVDLGAVHDPTIVLVAHRGGDGKVYVDTIRTLQGSRETPVQMESVEEHIRELSERFLVHKVVIESWQGLASAQRLTRLGLPVELLAPTAKIQAAQWPILAQALGAGRLILFPHAQLREELLGLVTEVGPHGVRVVDRTRGIHQDVAVALRMATALLAPPEEEIRLWGGEMGAAPRDVAQEQEAAAEVDRERAEASAAAIAAGIRRDGWWVPGGAGRLGR